VRRLPRRWQQLVEHAGIDRCGVGDHFSREHLQGSKRSGEESAGGGRVSSGREQHVDDLAVLVDGSINERRTPLTLT
jgi:hypothetical protein